MNKEKKFRTFAVLLIVLGVLLVLDNAHFFEGLYDKLYPLLFIILGFGMMYNSIEF